MDIIDICDILKIQRKKYNNVLSIRVCSKRIVSRMSLILTISSFSVTKRFLFRILEQVL